MEGTNENEPFVDPVVQGHLDLIAVSVLPIDAPWPKLEALGFVPGAPVPRDDDRFWSVGKPLFRHVTFPTGWYIEKSPSSRFQSYLYDERRVRRVGIWWNPYPLNRETECTICNVGVELAREVVCEKRGPVAIPEQWAELAPEERAQFGQETARLVHNLASAELTQRARELHALLA